MGIAIYLPFQYTLGEWDCESLMSMDYTREQAFYDTEDYMTSMTDGYGFELVMRLYVQWYILI